MFSVTKQTVKQCSINLGQFNSDRVNLLVTLFRDQSSCPQLVNLSDDFKQKFENLLTVGKNYSEDDNDTPTTRIELAIMIHFKQTYLSDESSDTFQDQSKPNVKLCVTSLLNWAYCFLLAQVDDRLKRSHLDHLKFLLNIKIDKNYDDLFDLYEKFGENLSNFFSAIVQCQYLAEQFVLEHKTILNFQAFIKRYEEFLKLFEKSYKPLFDNKNNDTQTDAISNQTNRDPVSIFISNLAQSNISPTKTPTSPTKENVLPQLSPPLNQQAIPESSSQLSSPFVPQKGLCVIINIKSFISSESIHTPKREGSDKDVELVKVIFRKLKYTILECQSDFTKSQLERALDYIDNPKEFDNFDCLVVFIMSHGLLNSFFTADSKEIIIKDIVKRYSDSSARTIWARKNRLFFIQACRSDWPDDVPHCSQQEIRPNDLSPKMLIAYSCSASQASKRSPTYGSIFIQIFCVMLFRHSHSLTIQQILDWTSKFVTKRDEICSQTKEISIQRPEYIQPNVKFDFRFSKYSLYETYNRWPSEMQAVISIPLMIWRDIYEKMYSKNLCNQQTPKIL